MSKLDDLQPIAADSKRVQFPNVIFGVIVTMIGGMGYLIWSAAVFRTQVLTDMNWVKTSLATLVTRFNELDVVQNQIKSMDKDGTVALKDLSQKVQSLQQRVDAYRDNGSPVNIEHERQLTERISKLEKEFEIHEATKGKQ